MPTRRGWCALLLLAAVAVFMFFQAIYPFLSVTDKVDADVLVVEGWIDDEALVEVQQLLSEGEYRLVIASGMPVTHWAELLPSDNYADLTRMRLVEAGVAKEKVLAAPAPKVRRNRTRAMAIALKRFLREKDVGTEAVNIFSVGPHARRSLNIYRHIMEPQYQVGVIAAEPSRYNAEDWWSSSEGVKSVLSETFAYVYNTAYTLFGIPLMNTLSIYIIVCLLGYLVGAIPFGFMIGKSRHIDVRRVGSGNIGATNVFRTVGFGWGVLALALDFLKGLAAAFFIPMAMGSIFGGEMPYLLGLAGGCAAILGHNYSIYLKFRGGKGIATSAGMLAGIAPIPFFSAVAVWLIVFLLTHYVSLGSIMAALAVAISSWVWNESGGYTLPILITIMAAFAIVRHRTNLLRLCKGTENRVSFRKGGGK